jgi:HSP90 family molecular chaperone
MRPVQGGRQEVDLGLEDVDALEHARGAVFQVLLQHAAIDEFDLPALHDFETTRPAQIYELSAIDNLQEVQIEERVVEVLAEILESEDRLVGDEARFVEVVALERERQGLLEDKIPDES